MYEMWHHIRGVSADSLSAACAWLGIIAFSFAFYYELRAYSHIAAGIGSMLVFELPDNFDLPFIVSRLSMTYKTICLHLL